MVFFDTWEDIGRLLVVGAFAYIGLVAFLRIAGKRTLSKLNAFDLVVTVALGSTLATIILSRDVSLAEGLSAFVLLIGLQFLVSWLSVRSKRFSEIVKSEPALLLYRGRFLTSAMRKERITSSEIREALRSQGYGSTEDVDSVILETDGTLSILKELKRNEGSTFSDVNMGAAQRDRSDE